MDILSTNECVCPENIQLPTPRMIIENSEGVGVLKSPFLKGKGEAKLEIPGRGGYKPNNNP